MKKIALSLLTLCLSTGIFYAQVLGPTTPPSPPPTTPNGSKFQQLDQMLPTPNTYRNAAGAPGHQYWQQQTDYKISIVLDDEKQRITGEETITFHNNSPDNLTYLWLQLDQNLWDKESNTYKISQSTLSEQVSLRQLKAFFPDFDGGFKIESIKDASGNALKYTINKTMMRVELPRSLKPNEKFAYNIKWWHNINDRMKIGGRSGYEYFEEDKNYLYTIAQFFPRMAVYNDIYGWQHKQFLGQGEYTLPFGNYEVSITVPEDHLVSATGELQNAKEVLTAKQLQLLEKAKTSYTEPVIIANEEEARKRETTKLTGKKTWRFKANNVRDFAFASSRKFIWDAMSVKMSNGSSVMAASMYPKEGNPLWEQFSTKAVAHTLKWYSHYTFDYPYPIAWSIHTNNIGMEYPMICFNGGRPEKDGTYNERTKYGMISVIIHEVGHNYFPMIVNSDERQWTWMDEGLNSFVQFLAEQQWMRDYPSRRGNSYNIAEYMKMDKNSQEPIMSNSESVSQLGNNAYGKPATALNILRETIMGRELFDYAFKEYSRRWMFKQPAPADFFRTMEDASAVDLDWFWRGWFYSTEHVDIAIDGVKWVKLDTKNPDFENVAKQNEKNASPKNISSIVNKETIKQTQDEIDRSIRDFYTDFNPFAISELDRKEYQDYMKTLSAEEKKFLEAGYNFYEIGFKNIGGLLMPLIVEFEFIDGTKEVRRIPAEIWKIKHDKVTKVFVTEKEVKQITLDPFLETADADASNNYYPEKTQLTRFQLFKERTGQQGGGENPMQRAKRAAGKKD